MTLANRIARKCFKLTRSLARHCTHATCGDVKLPTLLPLLPSFYCESLLHKSRPQAQARLQWQQAKAPAQRGVGRVQHPPRLPARRAQRRVGRLHHLARRRAPGHIARRIQRRVGCLERRLQHLARLPDCGVQRAAGCCQHPPRLAPGHGERCGRRYPHQLRRGAQPCDSRNVGTAWQAVPATCSQPNIQKTQQPARRQRVPLNKNSAATNV